LFIVAELNPLPRISKGNPLRLKQFVGVTGLGTDGFEDAIKGLRRWISALEAKVKPDTVQEWNAGTYSDWSSLPFTNCIFTKLDHAVGERDLPFNTFWDPNGTLAKAKNSQLVHTADNVVQYLTWVTDANGKR
jgi:hypothetical protein